MRLSFFSLPKPKQFSYAPRYYNEEKERAEQRKKELENTDGSGKPAFGDRLTKSWDRYKKMERTSQRKANISVIIYLFVAILLLYFVFFS